MPGLRARAARRATTLGAVVLVAIVLRPAMAPAQDHAPDLGQLSAADLVHHIHARREAGDFAGALEAARFRRDAYRDDASASIQARQEANAQVGSLEAIVALPPATQDSLAVAEVLTQRIRGLFRSDPAEAARLCRRQLEVRTRWIPGPHLDTATTLTFLALIQQNRGYNEEARQRFREALAMMVRLYGRDHLNTATGLNNLASAVGRAGDLLEAEALYRESLLSRQRVLGENHPVLAGSYNNLGTLLLRGGDWAAAEEMFRKALMLVEAELGADHRNAATALRHVASALRHRGELVPAEDALHRALRIFEDMGRDGISQKAQVLLDLARVAAESSRLAVADSLFHQSLEISQQFHGAAHPHVADILDGWGDLALRLENPEAAEARHQRALTIRRARQGPEHPATVSTQVRWAGDLLAHRRTASQAPAAGHPGSTLAPRLEADAALRSAAAAFEAARTRQGTGFRRATTALRSPYPLLAHTQLARGDPAAAWMSLEQHQGRLLAELLEIGQQRGLTAPQRAWEDSVRRRLARVSAEVAALREEAEGAEGSKDVGVQAEARYEELLALEAEWSRFQAEATASAPTDRGRPRDLRRIQRALPVRTALIGWLENEDIPRLQRWMWILRPSGDVQWVALPPVSDDPSGALRRELRAVDRPAFGLEPSSADAVSRRWWRAWFEPARRGLEGIENLIVVPSGSILGIPLEALRDDEGRLVGERFAVSYTPSASVVAWLLEGGAGTAVGGERTANPQPGTGAALVGRARSALLLGDPQYRRLPPLPATRREVMAVSALFPRSQVLVGAEASELGLRALVDSGRLETFDAIHVASHALTDAERPEGSAIILSQVDLPDPLEALAQGRPIVDGRVSVTEILATWKLRAQIVTLSACDTGLGRRVGSEGYLGLTHAMFLAGARSVLVSLWQADDEAASRLMTRFYELWLGVNGPPLSRSQALAGAKQELREVRDAAGRRPYAHPHYWAGFVLLGDPR